jgi:acylphosphatase
MTVAHTAVVRGRVQGVGFRYSTWKLAAEFGVKGWVRNQPDGSVRVWAQGSADSVDQLMAFLHRGPGGAPVASVEAHEIDPDPDLTRFEIRY